MKPGEIGIKIANIDAEKHIDHNATVLFSRYVVVITITEVTETLRDALHLDVEALLAGDPISYESVDYDEEFPNVFRIILTVRILN